MLSKQQLTTLLALLAILLYTVDQAEATCGQCYGSHTCTSNTSYQMCFDGKPFGEYTFNCPTEKPICTSFGDICRTESSPPNCGDTSKCDQCADGQKYACTSRSEFGYCQAGQLSPGRANCPKDYTCSVEAGKTTTPCVLVCNPDSSDMCDRVKDTDPIPDPPSFDVNAFCQTNQKAGRFAQPNDTVCNSYIQCYLRGTTWLGSMTICPVDKPYYTATAFCGIVKPTQPGCL